MTDYLNDILLLSLVLFLLPILFHSGLEQLRSNLLVRQNDKLTKSPRTTQKEDFFREL
jgi:hypothetical protein